MKHIIFRIYILKNNVKATMVIQINNNIGKQEIEYKYPVHNS